MEYIQMTIDEWMEMKKKIKTDLTSVKLAFVRIGYNLRIIQEQELYRNDGYKSIAEFAEAELQLKASTVSRLIAINKKFSIGGKSEFLENRYMNYDRAVLEEMLQLTDSDMEMVSEDTRRETVRELKRFNAEGRKAEASEEEVPEEDDALRKLIETFFRDNPDAADDLSRIEGYPEGNLDKMKEIVNPSGSRSVRSGAWIMIMNDPCIKIKRFGGQPETVEWDEFFRLAAEVVESYQSRPEFIEEAEEKSVEEDREESEETGEEQEEIREDIPKSTEQGTDSDIEPSVTEPDRSDREEYDSDHVTAAAAEGDSSESAVRPAENIGHSTEWNGDSSGPVLAGNKGNLGPVAPAQLSPEPAEKAEEKEETEEANREREVVEKLLRYATMLVKDIENREWIVAKQRIQSVEIFLEEIMEKNSET